MFALKGGHIAVLTFSDSHVTQRPDYSEEDRNDWMPLATPMPARLGKKTVFERSYGRWKV